MIFFIANRVSLEIEKETMGKKMENKNHSKKKLVEKNFLKQKYSEQIEKEK